MDRSDVYHSLSLRQVGSVHVLILEDLRPEAGKLMAVADLDDVELLNDASVKSQLFLLELGQDSLTEVQAEDVEKLILRL